MYEKKKVKKKIVARTNKVMRNKETKHLQN